MQSDGQMRAFMGAQPEHVPKAKKRRYYGHGKDQGALDGDWNAKDQSNHDKSRQNQWQDECGHKDAGQECA
jgi:hypothetical protein